MRILHESAVTAASGTVGTTYYRASLDDVIDVVSKDKSETVLTFLLNSIGFSCLNIDTMYGSFIDDDDIYICVTDGQPISVKGKEIEPENPLPSNISVDDISSYVADATDDVIKSNISYYELAEFDVEDVAIQMLEDGYSFNDVVKGMNELPFLDLDI